MIAPRTHVHHTDGPWCGAVVANVKDQNNRTMVVVNWRGQDCLYMTTVPQLEVVGADHDS